MIGACPHYLVIYDLQGLRVQQVVVHEQELDICSLCLPDAGIDVGAHGAGGATANNDLKIPERLQVDGIQRPLQKVTPLRDVVSGNEDGEKRRFQGSIGIILQ